MIGETISHYRVVRKLGGGGMGVVYEAEDARLGRRVALKLLPADFDPTPETLERFRREARAASALNHPHICTVYDVGEHDGKPFLVMERMAGKTLKRMIGGKALEIERVAELGSQIAHALEAAHAAGIVHRDVKPANVFVTKLGQAKVLDFGLAKMASQRTAEGASSEELTKTHLTRTGSTVGTVAYMSPEQARGEPVDARTDLFSLGVVLYEMATGALPFPGKQVTEILHGLLTQEPPPPSQLNPKVPPELERIILASLEKDRELRYQNASEARAELRRLQRDSTLPPSGSAAVASASATTTPGRRGLWAGLGAVAALAVALTAFWLGGGGRAPEGAGEVATADMPSIAVLPFADMSPEKDQEYFADGLTEELLNVLARLGGLRVAARTSSFSFKGKDVKVAEIARELNVSNLLEGSVRKSGDRVRITAQLVNVADGFHLWSNTYDRQLDDIFAVQDDIAGSVAEALEVELLGGRTAAAGGTLAEAYNAYLEGLYLEARYTEDDLKKAAGYYEEALRLDDGYAPAWAALSRTYFRLTAGFGAFPQDEGIDEARKAAQRALELDDTLAEAHIALGSIQLVPDWDWAGAEASHERALELAPNDAYVLSSAAEMSADLGRFDEALERDRRAVELDPLNGNAHFRYGLHAYEAGRLEEAAAALGKTLELNPARAVAHNLLGLVYLGQSQPEEALREMEKERSPGWRRYGLAVAYHALGRREEADAALREFIEKERWADKISEVYAYRGEADRAFEWLERAYAQRDPALTQILGTPLYASIEDDPRFAALLKKMGLKD